MARTLPIPPRTETSACPAVGSFASRLGDLDRKSARTFCREGQGARGATAGVRRHSSFTPDSRTTDPHRRSSFARTTAQRAENPSLEAKLCMAAFAKSWRRE
jgi:hypothetical protein